MLVEEFFTKKDQELVLRYFALKNNLDNYKKDFNFFLTNYMENVTTEHFECDYEGEKIVFEAVFKYLSDMFYKSWIGYTVIEKKWRKETCLKTKQEEHSRQNLKVNWYSYIKMGKGNVTSLENMIFHLHY